MRSRWIAGSSPATTVVRGRPCERRDPYAATSMFEQGACGLSGGSLETSVVMGPCAVRAIAHQAGTTLVFVVRPLNISNALKEITGPIMLAGAGKMGGPMLSGWPAQG